MFGVGLVDLLYRDSPYRKAARLLSTLVMMVTSPEVHLSGVMK